MCAMRLPNSLSFMGDPSSDESDWALGGPTPIDGTRARHYRFRGGGLELQAPRSKDAAFPSLWSQFMYQTIRVLLSTLYTYQNGSDR